MILLLNLIYETISNKLSVKTLIPKAIQDNVEDNYYKDLESKDLEVNDNLYDYQNAEESKQEKTKKNLTEITFDFLILFQILRIMVNKK